MKNCGKYFEWPEQSGRFEVINADASVVAAEMVKSKEEFEVIIVDISNDDQIDSNYPPLQFISL